MSKREAQVREEEERIREKANEVIEFLEIPQVADELAGNLSGGQKKLLELGRALMAEPRMIMLDEPVAGVNPTLAAKLADNLHDLRAEGYTLLIIEHDMTMVAKLCDPVVVLAEGRTLTSGTFASIAADPEVQQAYMGRRAGK